MPLALNLSLYLASNLAVKVAKTVVNVAASVGTVVASVVTVAASVYAEEGGVNCAQDVFWWGVSVVAPLLASVLHVVAPIVPVALNVAHLVSRVVSRVQIVFMAMPTKFVVLIIERYGGAIALPILV